MLSCINPSVRIVTKSSQVGPLFSISLVYLRTGERRNILGFLVVVCRAGQMTLQESLLLLVILRGHKEIIFSHTLCKLIRCWLYTVQSYTLTHELGGPIIKNSLNNKKATNSFHPCCVETFFILRKMAHVITHPYKPFM